MTVTPTNWLTGYAQFMDTHAPGLPIADTAANMRDNFDLRQGYLNFHYKPVQLLVGRFEIRIGDERVVGISDWTNNSRTWDGFYMRIGNKNQLNLFSTSVVTVHPTSLDTHGAGLTFDGVHAKLTTYVPHTDIEPFVLVRTEPRVESYQGTYGSETEVTFGSYYKTHWYGFDSSGTGMLQRGSYSNDSIQAGAGIVRGGYGAERLPWKPHLEVEYDYATGNSNPTGTQRGTFDQQYPSDHNAFGLVDLFGFQNIKQRRVNLQSDAEGEPADALAGRFDAPGVEERRCVFRRGYDRDCHAHGRLQERRPRHRVRRLGEVHLSQVVRHQHRRGSLLPRRGGDGGRAHEARSADLCLLGLHLSLQGRTRVINHRPAPWRASVISNSNSLGWEDSRQSFHPAVIHNA